MGAPPARRLAWPAVTTKDWATLAAPGGLMMATASFLVVRIDRRFDVLRSEVTTLRNDMGERFDRVEGRLSRLEDACIRHLEQHACH